jgi:hypothetical protein
MTKRLRFSDITLIGSLILVLLFLLVDSAKAATAQSQINELKTQVLSLRSDLTALQQQVAKDEQLNQQNHDALSGQITKIGEAIDAINKEIASIKSQLPPPIPPPSDPPPTEPPPPTSSCVGTSVTGPGVLTAGAYCVQQDLQCADSCFSVQGSNVTLDLNGHTITYGTGNTANRRHGIVGIGCSTTKVDGNPCGGTFNNFTVKNGKIIQGGGGAYSHAISFGPGGGDGLVVENVEILVSGESAKAVYGTYVGGAKVSGVKAISTSLKVTNRHQLDGVLIGFHEGVNESPVEISNSELIGSPQGGILATPPGSKIHHNKVRLNSYYTNGFCFYGWGPNSEIYNNECDNTQGNDAGRGVHVYTSGVSVHDNVLKVRELRRNMEYKRTDGSPGCVAGGAYGIQIEGGSGVRHFNNKVTAIADECDASAIRVAVGRLGVSGNALGYNETLESLRATPTSVGRALGVTTLSAFGYELKDSSVKSSQYFLYDVSQINSLKDPTTPPTDTKLTNIAFSKDTVNPTASFYSWRMDNYGQAATITCAGCTFLGSSPTSISGYAIGQPSTLMHKEYTLNINGQFKAYNTTTQAVVVEQVQ